MEIAIILLIVLVPFAIIEGMARRRNRSRLGWVVVGLLLTPLVPFVLLLCLGYAEDLPTSRNNRGRN